MIRTFGPLVTVNTDPLASCRLTRSARRPRSPWPAGVVQLGFGTCSRCGRSGRRLGIDTGARPGTVAELSAGLVCASCARERRTV